MSRLTVLSPDCEKILSEGRFAVVGVSPFNSYFSVENIMKMIKYAAENFEECMVFIPDKISIYTLEALGYPETEARQKTRRQDNYLKNKTQVALKVIAEHHNANVSILLLSEMLKNERYTEAYKSCIKEFDTNEEFREGCIDTSRWVIEAANHNKKNAVINRDVLMKAVKYFLYEFPILTNSAKIQNKESCMFIYTSTPKFLKQIYNNRCESKLVDQKQGYGVFSE